MTKTYELKVIGDVVEVTDLSEEAKKRIEELGYLYCKLDKDVLLYHLIPKLDNDNNKKVTISFLKGLYSYGFERDLWEAAILKRRRVKGITGYLTEDDLLTYIEEQVKNLNEDLDYFDKILYENRQRNRENARINKRLS